MKFPVLLLALCLYAGAQTPTGKPDETSSPPAKQSDPALHANVMKLFEMIDLRQKVLDAIKQKMPEAKKQMMENCQRCTSAFADEWEKRMLARTNVEDYVDVYLKAYEKYLTVEDVNELVALQKAKQASQTAAPSARLKEKLTSVMPSLMSEIMGGCTQIGAKQGGGLGREIEQEHPEYMKPQPKESDKP